MQTQANVTTYEIRLKGHLGANVLIWFEEFTTELTPAGETILRGPIVDQAALSGILSRILDLGLSLMLFRELGQDQTSADTRSED